jgi:4-hydroxythreonine-4-phosphate dehydrogenase
VVTGPVHKASINAGGIAYTGTTELLARPGRVRVVMMLANPTLRVALATTHLPLRAVPDAITREALERTLRIVDAALRRDFGWRARASPCSGSTRTRARTACSGARNRSHRAGAGAPAREGLALRGPLPADTAFLPALLAEVDVVVAMYHDQGLPVLKHAGFEQGVNVTLGLPYRAWPWTTAPRWKSPGAASPDASSLFAAVDLCTRLARGGHA